jgi:hypothetical protein
MVAELPTGFEVLRADLLDPVQGRRDQWLYRGVVGERSVIRSGFGSPGAARRAAWAAYNSATLMGAEQDSEENPEPARYQPILVRPPEMRDEYLVKLGSWEQMKSDLLSQIIADAGSIRRAAKAIGVPKSTLSAWVREGVSRRVWPG